MAVILELQQHRKRLAAKRGFEAWTRRFSETFHERTSLEDLSDSIIRVLIQSGKDSSMPLYELIMGFMGLGKGAKFYDLERPSKLAVMDITLFLLDQLRFEAMRRLGWVEASPLSRLPLLELVERFSSTYSSMNNYAPALLRSHPRYREYREMFEADRPVFIRQLIPDALEAFQEKDEGA